MSEIVVSRCSGVAYWWNVATIYAGVAPRTSRCVEAQTEFVVAVSPAGGTVLPSVELVSSCNGVACRRNVVTIHGIASNL